MARKIVATLSAFVLACGLMPLTALADEPADGSASVQLEPGTYVEHEAIAYVVDAADDGGAPLSAGGDALDGAESLMEVGADAVAESVDDAAAGQAEGTAVSARSSSLLSESDEGRLVLVRDEGKTTEQIIEELMADDRVVFAEPNYLVESSDGESASPDGEDDAQVPATSQDDAQDPVASQDETGIETDSSTVARSSETVTYGADASGSAPDLTSFQWAYRNDGSFAGVAEDEAVDLEYQAWKDAAESGNWAGAAAGSSLEEVVVAVIDDGVDASNPDLASVMWDGGDAVSYENPGGATDEHGFSACPDGSSTEGITNGHGTHVAGIIAAAWNDQGTSGLAPNAKIMSVRHNNTVSSMLSCLGYVAAAAEQGVNVRVANNSWGMGANASLAIDAAVTKMGEAGVVSVFASGNGASDLDAATNSVSLLASNPYVVAVDALDADGAKSSFSNWGAQTTDVMAPGSAILSTWLTNDQQYLGEADQNPVLYESFDGETKASTEAKTADGAVVQDGTQNLTFHDDAGNPVGEVRENAARFDGTAALSLPYKTADHPLDPANQLSIFAKVTSNALDLSGVQENPRYFSIRYLVQPDDAGLCGMASVSVSVSVVDSNGNQAYGTLPMNMGSFGVNVGGSVWSGFCVDLEAFSESLASSGYTIDWASFKIQIQYAAAQANNVGGIADNSTLIDASVLIDSIGLGNDKVPYQYQQGTSMAAPAVAGAACVMAGSGTATVADDPAQSAKNLVALVRGAAKADDRYTDLCSTGGCATVEQSASPDPRPVPEPAPQQGELYEQANLPVPDQLADWNSWQLVGFAGDVYALPQENEGNPEAKHTEMLRFDPDAQTWEAVPLPLEQFTAAGVRNVASLSGATYRGELVMQVTSFDRMEGEIVYVSSTYWSYSAQGEWKQIPVELPGGADLGFSTLATDGETLYAFGGEGSYGLQLGTGYLDSSAVLAIDVDAGNAKPMGQMQWACQNPRVAYRDGAFLVAGGQSEMLQLGGVMGIQRLEPLAEPQQAVDPATGAVVEYPVGWLVAQPVSTSQQVTETGQMAWAPAAVKDGFMVVGPESDAGTADTYLLANEAGASLQPYELRAAWEDLLIPSALAYEGKLYVLAAATPAPYRVFSATAVETVAQPGDYVAPEPKPPAPEEEGTLEKLASTGDSLTAPMALLGAAACIAGVALLARRHVR